MNGALSILHAPCHGPSLDLGAIRFACSLGADSIGFTEAYAQTRVLRRRVAYRCRVGRSSTDTRRIASPRGDAGDVPILIRRRHRLVEWSAERVTPPTEPLKFGPERWITTAVYEHPFGFVEHLNAHPNPRFVGEGSATWQAYLDRLESRIVRAQRRGHHVIVTGDLQAVSGPLRMFDRLDLDAWRVGIDYIAHSPHLRRVESSRLVDPSQVGQRHPHPWLLARFAL